MLSVANAIALTATAFFGASSASTTPPSAGGAAIPFDEARIFIEYNATDQDAEVVVEIDADVGLARFAVVSPHGKEVLGLRSRNTQDLGIRKIALETPEPSLQAVLDAYPPGNYRFIGKSVDGQSLFSIVTLSHSLPTAPQFTFPLDGDVDVPTSGASATWSAGPDAESFFFELEQDDLGVDLKSNIGGDATSFGFPEGWLAGRTEYQMGIGARGANGNLTVVEIHFTTEL